MQKKNLNVLAMVLTAVGMSMTYIMQFAPSPFLMTIRDQFGLTSDVAINMVVNVIFITVFVGCMTGTALERRFGTITLFTVALGLVVVGNVIQAMSANSYVGLLVGRAIFGLGNGLCFPFFGSAVMRWSEERTRETMNTANGMFPFLGTAVCFVAAVPLTDLFGGHWEFALTFWLVPTAVALVLWVALIRPDKLIEYEDSAEAVEESELQMYRYVLGRREIRYCTYTLICDFSCFSYISTILPVLLFEASTMSESLANNIAAIAFPMVGLVGGFIGGYLLAKTGLRKPYLVVAQIGKFIGVAIAILLSGVSVWFIVVGMAVFGFFNALWMPAFYCVPMDLDGMSASRAGAAIALMVGISLLSGFIAPTIGGAATDMLSVMAGLADPVASHVFGLKWSLFAFGFLNLIGFYFMLRIPETGTRR